MSPSAKVLALAVVAVIVGLAILPAKHKPLEEPAPSPASAMDATFQAGADKTLNYMAGPASPASYSASSSYRVFLPPMPTPRAPGRYRTESGHEAGREWAAEHGIEDADDCTGNSQSFIEGCQDYVEEHCEDDDCTNEE